MNVTLTPGAATDDAAQIDSIVSTIEECAETLDTAIKNNIPSGIETTWSETVRNNWEKYYGDDFTEAFEEMRASATNLRLAVEQALSYDQEK